MLIKREGERVELSSPTALRLVVQKIAPNVATATLPTISFVTKMALTLLPSPFLLIIQLLFKTVV